MGEAPPSISTGHAGLALISHTDDHRLHAEAALAYLEERAAEVHVKRLEAVHALTPDDGGSGDRVASSP